MSYSHEHQPLLANSDRHEHADRISLWEWISMITLGGGDLSFIGSTRYLLLSSWSNVLLVFIPFSFLSEKHQWDPAVKLLLHILATIPLAKLLSESLEQLSGHFGVFGLALYILLGTSVEIILGITAILRDAHRIFRGFMLGSLLSYSLFALGISFLASGIIFHESNFQVTPAQTGASLITLACIALVIPTAYYSSQEHYAKSLVLDGGSNKLAEADTNCGITGSSQHDLLLATRGTAIILLILYFGFVYFQAETHSDLFVAAESYEDRDSGVEEPAPSAISAAFWLFVSISTVSFILGSLVKSIEETAEKHRVSELFLSLAVPPLVNAIELYELVCKRIGSSEFKIATCLGNSIQIATFVIPVLVIFIWVIGKSLILCFSTFEAFSLLVSVVVVHMAIMNGKSNYMDGSMLCGLYFIIMITFWNA